MLVFFVDTHENKSPDCDYTRREVVQFREKFLNQRTEEVVNMLRTIRLLHGFGTGDAELGQAAEGVAGASSTLVCVILSL